MLRYKLSYSLKLQTVTEQEHSSIPENSDSVFLWCPHTLYLRAAHKLYATEPSDATGLEDSQVIVDHAAVTAGV